MAGDAKDYFLKYDNIYSWTMTGRLERAYRIAEEKIGFYMHLTAFVVVNAGLWLLWYFSGGGFPWPAFITFFWGFGLVMHGAGTLFGHGYKNRIAEREYEKMRRQRP